MSDDYPVQKQRVEKAEPHKWTPEQWVLEDCMVRECIDGFIHFEDRGYDTVARCSRCQRGISEPLGVPATGIPVYTGRVTFRTETEMDSRLNERKAIVEDSYVARKERAGEKLEKAKRIGAIA